MLLLYVILLSALAGSFVTLLLQLLLLYRRKPEPPGAPRRPGPGHGRVLPEPSLRDYLQGGEAEPGEETCHFLNAVFLFLFRELRDTALVRRWVTKKIKVEFEELLQTKVTGKVLEGLSLRDVSLGDVVPLFKAVRLLRPVAAGAEGCPEELGFEVDVEYNGGFHLAIDADLVFGKSAYLFVRISRVLGRLKLVFTRLPFTHWSFAFVDDPLVVFEVKSQFEGRPMPQLTSLIVNQFKKVIKRKHTLPNYKIRWEGACGGGGGCGWGCPGGGWMVAPLSPPRGQGAWGGLPPARGETSLQVDVKIKVHSLFQSSPSNSVVREMVLEQTQGR